MNNYRKGYLFERKVKMTLENFGFTVIRSPASKSPYDLLAIKENIKLFIQCKKTKSTYLYVYNLLPLIEIAKKNKGLPILAYSFNRTPIYFCIIDEENVKFKKEDKHITYKEFLKDILVI